MLLKTKRLLSQHAKKFVYYAQIYSHLSYGIGIWGPMSSNSQIKKIKNIQKKCLHCIGIDISNFLDVHDIIKLEILKFGWKLVNNRLPSA